MVERLFASACRLDENAELIDYAVLPDVLVEILWPQRKLDTEVFGIGGAREQ